MANSKKYKIRSPYRSDELITQEVLTSRDLQYDYSQSPWIAIDTEYLSLDFDHDTLCTIQLASPVSLEDNTLRTEIVWVWEAEAELKAKFAEFLKRTDLTLIMHVASSDLPRIEKFAEVRFAGKLFDTKVAGKIVLTNTSDHGMADLINSLIDPKFVKDRKITLSQWDIDPESWEDNQFEYAMKDVVYLHALQLALERIAVRRHKTEILAETMTALPAICRLFAAGYNERVFLY